MDRIAKPADLAASYPRVSSDEQQRKGYSIPQQRDINERHIRTQGYTFVGHYDEDFTGTISKRPRITELLALARERKITVIVCTVIDRFARYPEVGYELEAEFEKNGVRVEYVLQDFEDTADGHFTKGIFREMAARDVRRIAELTRGGRCQKAREKNVNPLGLNVFGYHTVSKAEALILPEFAGRDGELIVEEIEAAIVRAIYQMVADGRSLRGIGAELERGVEVDGVLVKPITKRGRSHWHAASIRKIILNPIYCGSSKEEPRYWWGRTRCKNTKEVTEWGNIRVLRRPADPEDWIPIIAPRVVSDDLWNAANAAISTSKRREGSTDWPLAGIVFCARCKGIRGGQVRAHGHTKNGKRRYRCQSYVRRDLGGCCGVILPADELEKMAYDALAVYSDPKRVAQIERDKATAERARLLAANSDTVGLERQLAALDEREEALLEQSLKGYSERVISKKLAEVQVERARISDRVAEMAKAPLVLPDPDEAAKRGAEWARQLRRDCEAGEIQKALRRLRIVVGGEKVEIHVGAALV